MNRELRIPSRELRVLDRIQRFRTPLWDAAMPKISLTVLVFPVIAILMMLSPGTMKCGIAMLAACLFASITSNFGLKQLFHRARPFEANPCVELLIRPPADYSFPSAHTATAFAAAFALMLTERRGIWAPVLFQSAMIAYSRMYLYVHYPTDILAGVLFGGVSGCVGAVAAQQLMILI